MTGVPSTAQTARHYLPPVRSGFIGMPLLDLNAAFLPRFPGESIATPIQLRPFAIRRLLLQLLLGQIKFIPDFRQVLINELCPVSC